MTCVFVNILTTSLTMLQRKLFLGARLKRLRRERGLNQSQMADELGISASYLNHLERNQRPVTAGHPAAAGRGVRRRREGVRVRGRRRRRRDPARRDLLRPDARRPRRQPRTSWSSWPTMRRRSPKASPGSTRPCARCSAGPSGRGAARRPAVADHARDLGARLYPGAAQPLSRARGSVRDAGRRAQPSAVHGRAAAAAAEGGVGRRGPRRRPGDAGRRQPALRSAAARC